MKTLIMTVPFYNTDGTIVEPGNPVDIAGEAEAQDIIDRKLGHEITAAEKADLKAKAQAEIDAEDKVQAAAKSGKAKQEAT